MSVELGECCDILTGCQVLVRELLCSLNEGRGDRNSQDLPVCVCSGFLASKSSWAGLDKSHRVFLSCEVHPPTADVTPGGAAALFLGKTSVFQTQSLLFA